MIKNWSVDQIISEIRKIQWAGNDPRSDGFTTWHYKKEMYHIKWALEEMMSNMSTYEGEKEFVRDHEKTLVWNALKEQ